MEKLTEKQKRFADEYLIDLNATQAAIRAGYKDKWAHTNANKLLQNTTLQEYLQLRREELQKITGITQERVLNELARIGFADIRKAVRWRNESVVTNTETGESVLTNAVMLTPSDEIDDETAAAISEVSETAQGVKIKFYDKRAALVDIGRHLGMFTEKVDLNATVGGDDILRSVLGK